MKRMICGQVLVIAVILVSFFWQPAEGARKALIVGVEEYAAAEHNLKGVKEDIHLLKALLVQKGIFTNAEIKTLVDKEATRANILKSFREWLIQGTRPGDTALFYFSGHGVQIWDENGDEIDDGMDEALMPYDARPLKNRERREFRGRAGYAFAFRNTQNFILDDEIGELLQQLKGRTVVFISDSCHSGSVHKGVNPYFVRYKTISDPITYKSVFDPRVSESNSLRVRREGPNILSNLKAEGTRLVVLTASEDSQPAEIVRFDKEPKGIHSVMTWYLINGLQGRADLNGDGKITFGELAKYLTEDVKRDGYAQIPQHDFQPKSMADEVFLAKTVPPQPVRLERPDKITVSLKTDATLSASERDSVLSYLKQSPLPVSWSDNKAAAVGLIEVQKTGETYGARLSDATGAYWETHRGPILTAVLESALKNLRAYYVQINAAALRNGARTLGVDLDYKVKGSATRRPGEVVKGDSIAFQVKARTPGYLYLFSVDCSGVIHPIYPQANAEPKKLNADESIVIGEDGLSIKVQEPLGKEVIFAFLASQPLESLKSFWAKDDVGDASKPGITEQAKFLEAMWNELTASGKPRGDWASRLWSLESFESTK